MAKEDTIFSAMISGKFWLGVFIGSLFSLYILVKLSIYLYKINKIAFDYLYVKIKAKRTKGEILKKDSIIIDDPKLINGGIMFTDIKEEIRTPNEETECTNDKEAEKEKLAGQPIDAEKVNNLKFINTLIQSFFELVFDRDLIVYLVSIIEEKVNRKAPEAVTPLPELANQPEQQVNIEISNDSHLNESGLFSKSVLPLLPKRKNASSPEEEQEKKNESVMVVSINNADSKIRNFQIGNINIDEFGFRIKKAFINSAYLNERTSTSLKIDFTKKEEGEQEGLALNLKKNIVTYNRYLFAFETVGIVSLNSSFDFLADIGIMKGTIPLSAGIEIKKIYGSMDTYIYNFAKILQNPKLAANSPLKVTFKSDSKLKKQIEGYNKKETYTFITLAEVSFPTDGTEQPLKADLEITPEIQSNSKFSYLFKKISGSVVSVIRFAINMVLKTISKDTWVIVKELTSGKIILATKNELVYANK